MGAAGQYLPLMFIFQRPSCIANKAPTNTFGAYEMKLVKRLDEQFASMPKTLCCFCKATDTSPLCGDLSIKIAVTPEILSLLPENCRGRESPSWKQKLANPGYKLTKKLKQTLLCSCSLVHLLPRSRR